MTTRLVEVRVYEVETTPLYLRQPAIPFTPSPKVTKERLIDCCQGIGLVAAAVTGIGLMWFSLLAECKSAAIPACMVVGGALLTIFSCVGCIMKFPEECFFCTYAKKCKDQSVTIYTCILTPISLISVIAVASLLFTAHCNNVN